jgi:hypothetical protein
LVGAWSGGANTAAWAVHPHVNSSSGATPGGVLDVGILVCGDAHLLHGIARNCRDLVIVTRILAEDAAGQRRLALKFPSHQLSEPFQFTENLPPISDVLEFEIAGTKELLRFWSFYMIYLVYIYFLRKARKQLFVMSIKSDRIKSCTKAGADTNNTSVLHA